MTIIFCCGLAVQSTTLEKHVSVKTGMDTGFPEKSCADK
jgi:hypothetical protein